MLIPVLGRAGSGKTTFVLERLLQAAKKGRVLLLVPEQFSFEMEKQVYELLSRHGDQQLSLNVEVYSFTRLCHRVFTEWGGMAGEYVTDAARQLPRPDTRPAFGVFPTGKKHRLCRQDAAAGGRV